MKEGYAIQHQFSRQHQNRSRSAQQTARVFSKLMMEGRVRAALQLIAEDSNGGPLQLDSQIGSDGLNTTPETVREILLKKHPPKQSPKQSSIITPDAPIVEPHPVLFDKIDGLLIRSTALRMDGAAGPSGLDTAAWKRMCTSFKSTDLCDALASIARRICSCIVDPSHLPSHCICGRQFTVEHALNCPRGGFPSIRHNEIRDITADLLSEVCHSVGTEPNLQPGNALFLMHGCSTPLRKAIAKLPCLSATDGTRWKRKGHMTSV